MRIRKPRVYHGLESAQREPAKSKKAPAKKASAKKEKDASLDKKDSGKSAKKDRSCSGCRGF